MLRRRLLALLLPAALLAAPSPAAASPAQESMFQDDPLLVYGDLLTQGRALERLQQLGVDRVRVSVFWRLVAPAAEETTKPAGFNGRDHTAYPPGAWDRYDRLLRAARFRGMKVNFNLTAPGPKWAMGDPGDRPDLKAVWTPSPSEWGDFVFAAAKRYDGTTPGLPRVDYWTIWNEPNQGAWLAPQWAPPPGATDASRLVETSPRMYRTYVDAARAALDLAGHAQDTVLIGETAPKGSTDRGPSRPMKPRRFLLRLYCLDDNLQWLKGDAAREMGCPPEDQAAQMRAQHPGLYRITGYAHHPYELTQRPDVAPPDPEFLTLGNLRTLNSLLVRIFARAGAPIPQGAKRFPIYLTEFGYQTDPPDPAGVSNAQQAEFLNLSEWITHRNLGVKALAQFLLVDDKPGPGDSDVERFGASFQSGLITQQGRRKPAYGAYRLPIVVRRPRIRRGQQLVVWGLARAGRNGTAQPVRIEARRGRKGAWRTVRTVQGTPARGYFQARVKVARTGAVRLAWVDPATKRTHRSRVVAVTVR